MFPETFFAALSLWRGAPTPTPRVSSWHLDADGIERRFVLASAPRPRRRRRTTQATIPPPMRAPASATIPMVPRPRQVRRLEAMAHGAR